jgi:flagellar hook-associated protein FlgK
MLNILNVAQTGLSAAQIQVENTSNNLANENVAGYKKRTVNISELAHADARLTGRGISMDGVDRTINTYMYQNLVNEEAKLTDLDKLDDMLEGIEAIFYETDDTGLSADLNAYFKSVENLRTNPANEVYKNDMISSGNMLLEDIKKIYSDIENQEKALKSETKNTVDTINGILNDIGTLSKQILLQPEGSTNDLLDKRDQLELELAKYVDVDISRESTYELKVAGQLAVRFDTNVHELKYVENYIPQRDIYTQTNPSGSTKYVGGQPVSNLIDPNSWDGTNAQSEVQTVKVSDTATSQVYFLGAKVANADGTAGHSTNEEIVDDIVADKDNIIVVWNEAHPEAQISDIAEGDTADELKITYKDTEGDVSYLKRTTSNGITFAQSVEQTKGYADSVTYTLNNGYSVKASYGEYVYDNTGAEVDLNNDGTVDDDDKIDENNIVNALVYKINHDTNINQVVAAYNGPYEIADDGSKILTNDPRHSQYDATDPEKDRYLIVESLVGGEAGSFQGEILVNDDDNAIPSTRKEYVQKNKNDSIIAQDDTHIEIYDEEVIVKGGSLKAMLDNTKTTSGSNLFTEYKTKLDQFANALVDMSNTYIENDDGSYVFGTNAVGIDKNSDKKVDINLFSGSDVKTLKFNDNEVAVLTQEKLDYLAQIQWKTDVDFDGTGQNKSSFSEFYQTTRVKIADDRENVISKKENQEAVKHSLESSYDKITKVDKDEEMLDLIKFQAAYDANAKVITTLNEMLQTLLNLKR